MLSPLRYPGGKSDFAATAVDIVRSLNAQNATILEPYAGSSIVSLTLLEAQAVERAILVERDPLVYAFWHCVFNRFDEFIEKFIDLPINLKTWTELQSVFKVSNPHDGNVVELGLACLFFNRANFSGILNAGPIGGKHQKSAYTIDCRTNKDEIIVRLLSIAGLAKRIEVIHGDALEAISRFDQANFIYYLDPPYFMKGEALYRHFYGMNDHRNLASALADVKAPWFLSYDDHPVIEFLYEHQHATKLNFRYSVGGAKFRDEMLISNFAIPPEVLGELARPARQLHTAGRDMDGATEPSRLHAP